VLCLPCVRRHVHVAGRTHRVGGSRHASGGRPRPVGGRPGRRTLFTRDDPVSAIVSDEGRSAEPREGIGVSEVNVAGSLEARQMILPQRSGARSDRQNAPKGTVSTSPGARLYRYQASPAPSGCPAAAAIARAIHEGLEGWISQIPPTLAAPVRSRASRHRST